jgi:hypothetical protein
MEEHSSLSNVTVSPNPTSGIFSTEFTVRRADKTEVYIRVIDGKTTNEKAETGKLMPGIYNIP